MSEVVADRRLLSINGRYVWVIPPIGLALTVVFGMEGLLPLGVFLPIEVAYLALTVSLIRARGSAGLLALPAAVLFVPVAWIGPPTADEPVVLVLNTTALVAAAVMLVIGTAVWARKVPGTASWLSVLLLALGTAGYLANLMSRYAVVLAGATADQAAVEDRAWQAFSYLQGLDGPATFVTFLLVWMDLLQLAYIVSCYLSAGLLAFALHRAGRLRGRVLAITGLALAGLLVLGMATGSVLPAGAYLAFGLSIPFTSTILPVLISAQLRD